jgi:hypothetical protein
MSNEKKYAALPAMEAYCKRIGAVRRNFRRWVREEEIGPRYKKDRDVISINIQTRAVRFDVTKDEFKPTAEEKAAIEKEAMEATFPKSIHFGNKDNILSKVRKGSTVTFFVDRKAEEKTKPYIMAQERYVKKDGSKVIIPWTVWDDGQARPMEPDSALLPLWKPDHATGLPIMIHEGEKAARFCDDLVNSPARRGALADHPWGAELQQYEHWGWIGGAGNPHRTDWASVPDGVDVVVVADKDAPGINAVSDISRRLNRPLKAIMFRDESFPEGFDLADDWPAEFFVAKVEGGNETFYDGPTLDGSLRPVTWATKIVSPPKEKKVQFALLDHFAKEWIKIANPSAFINKHRPQEMMNIDQFNGFIAPYSHKGVKVAEDLEREIVTKLDTISYRPGSKRQVHIKGKDTYNVWMPPRFKPQEGDPAPFLEYLAHLIPDPDDRLKVMRYLATLIARPQTRLFFGLFLVSQTQGVGKSLLALVLNNVLGESNCSFPRESQIVEGKFNTWMAEKRLVFVHEIFAGRSYKAYDKLKEYITEKNDEGLEVERKYMDPYKVENWAHFILCSNYMKGLYIPNDDRRWFIPEVNEKKLPHKKATEFVRWLRTGGYSIIMKWAEDFLEDNKPFEPGENAPVSDRKKLIVDEGRDDDQRMAFDFATALVKRANGKGKKQAVIRGSQVRDIIVQILGPTVKVKKLMYLRSEFKDGGLKQHPGSSSSLRIMTDTGADYVFATFDMEPGEAWASLWVKGGKRAEKDLWKEVFGIELKEPDDM